MSQGHFIGLNHHRTMLRDTVRMESYKAAIEAVVRPGDVVLDLGTGTGVLAMWAAKAGARKVYAVDPAPVINLAKELALANEGGDRITFLQADSRKIDLPEKADVLVSECMGNFYVTDEMASVARDVKRHLKDDARLIPQHFHLKVAPAFLPHLDDVTFWENPVGGLDLSGGRKYAMQITYSRHIPPELLVAPPEELLAFDLTDSPDTIDGELAFSIDKARTVHGLVGWFDARLTDDIMLSTGPGIITHWGQVFFPIEPVSLSPGSRLNARMVLTLNPDYTSRWQWSGTAYGPTGDVAGTFSHDTDMRFG
jgi:ubiquinone/menaquinone biosynthesis C-methylase UbiE